MTVTCTACGAPIVDPAASCLRCAEGRALASTQSLASREGHERSAAFPEGGERLQPGTVIADRYQLVRHVGEGGMGSVWEAKHLQTRRRVALKFIKGHRAASALARRRALREARAATVVQHPNILAVQDIFEVEGAPLLVMDLLEGESLGRWLGRRQKLPLAEAASILVRVASAIGTAHAAGIVHRDLKPDNIFLVRLPDGGWDVKVVDFGLAKLTATEGDAATSGGLTRSGDIVGTPHYMSPEQAFGEQDIDHRADVWSLGVVIYECLSGTRPFLGANMGQVLRQLVTAEHVPLSRAAPEVPADVGALVDRMLSVDRAGRPNDLKEVRELLRRHCGVDAPSFDLPRAAPSAELERPAPRRWPVLLGLGFAVAVAAIGVRWVSHGSLPPAADPTLPAAIAATHRADAAVEPAPPTTSPQAAVPPPAPPQAALAAPAPATEKAAPRRGHRRKVTVDDDETVPLFAE